MNGSRAAIFEQTARFFAQFDIELYNWYPTLGCPRYVVYVSRSRQANNRFQWLIYSSVEDNTHIFENIQVEFSGYA
jgi:hypothetical protein